MWRLCLLFLALCSTAYSSTASVGWLRQIYYVDGTIIESGTTVYYAVFRATRSDLADSTLLGTTDKTIFYDQTAQRKVRYYYQVAAYVVAGKYGPKSAAQVFMTNRP